MVILSIFFFNSWALLEYLRLKKDLSLSSTGPQFIISLKQLL